MKEIEAVNMHRRGFLASSPLLLLAAGYLKASAWPEQTAAESPVVGEELNPTELGIVNNSIMAKDMSNFWGKGYSCAETGLMVALRFMKKSEDLVWAAGGFGGGMGHQDLCGFLTAGIMAIGLHAGTLKIDKSEAKNHCSRSVKEYWDWWTSTAPLRCSNIREGHQGFGVCQRLGNLASARLEDLIKA